MFRREPSYKQTFFRVVLKGPSLVRPVTGLRSTSHDYVLLQKALKDVYSWLVTRGKRELTGSPRRKFCQEDRRSSSQCSSQPVPTRDPEVFVVLKPQIQEDLCMQ